MEPVFVGIEIGGTKIQVVTGDGQARVKDRKRFVADSSRGGEGIREQIVVALKEIQMKESISSVGVGFGGPFNRETGLTSCSHQVAGWDNFPLKQWLSGLADGATVNISNDANAAALAEARVGAGQDKNLVFYITIGSGIGGGFVVNGQIYHGSLPSEMEVGHLRINHGGETFESRCSGWSIDRRLRDYMTANPDSYLTNIAQDDTAESKYLLSAINKGDEGARSIFDELCRDLALGLSHVVHILNPEVIILGGGLSLMGEPLREGVEMNLNQFIMSAMQPGPEVKLSMLKEDVVPVGALYLALMNK
ncbi:MAG: ROK family protein [Verrucomicrobiota bacterium]|nr:ROK family protein [Verrucomicrobiota bacterium]